MSWEPITYCRECDEPFDVYHAPSERICESCKECAGSDVAEVIVCAGPPICLLEGDEAVANAQAGCPNCRRIKIKPDGSENEYHRKAN